jgi:hypothetical protein
MKNTVTNYPQSVHKVSTNYPHTIHKQSTNSPQTSDDSGDDRRPTTNKQPAKIYKCECDSTHSASLIQLEELCITCEARMLVVSEATVLRKGLQYVGFSQRRQRSVNRETNLERFRSNYGSNPIVYAVLLHDFHTTENPEAHVNVSRTKLKPFFLAIHWLYCYPTEHRMAGTFGYCAITCRKYAWYFAKKIQALKEEKVRRPEVSA